MGDAPDCADDNGLFRDVELPADALPVMRKRRRHAIRDVDRLLCADAFVPHGKRNRALRVEHDLLRPPCRQAIQPELMPAFIDIFGADGRNNHRHSGKFCGNTPDLIAVEQEGEDNVRLPGFPGGDHAPDAAQQDDIESADNRHVDSGGAERLAMRGMHDIFQAIHFLFELPLR